MIGLGVGLAVALAVAAFFWGQRRGETRGRAEVEIIARQAAIESSREAQHNYRRETTEAVQRLEQTARIERERGQAQLVAVANPIREDLAAVKTATAETQRQAVDAYRKLVEDAASRLQRETKAERERGHEQLVAVANPIREQLAAVKTANAQAQSQAVDAYRKLVDEAANRLQREARAEREHGEQRLDKVANPLREQLRKVVDLATELGKQRATDHGQLTELAKRISSQVENVEASARSLREALKGDRQARGRWGEMQLQALVESVGLAKHVDFVTQTDLKTGRPDLVIRLPGNGRIAVDAKAPMDDFLSAAEATSEEGAEKSLVAHAKRVRAHADELSKRSYPDALGGGPPFAVMFLPMDALLSEAVRQDPGLLEYAGDRQVVLTTPHTLLGLLWAIATLWRGEERVRNATELAKEALEVESRLRTFLKHFAEVRKHFGQAAKAYNAAVGSAESRLFPHLKRFRELSGHEPQAERLLKPVETVLRPSPEMED